MSKHHHHHKKCQSCNKHRPHYHKHCHHHHHKHHEHHEHHHHKRHCYHHKMHHRRVCPPCPPIPPTPTITYACSGAPNFTCGPVLDGTGFATLEECQAACAAPVDQLLGTAANFRVLAASAITNTGATAIDGNLGLSPNGLTSITGFPPGTVSGEVDAANATSLQAQADLTTAYNTVTATPTTTDLSGQDLGGMTLLPGVYNFATSAQLTGHLILNGAGNSNAVWMFKIDSTLTTAPASSVTFINGGQADNVYWQVGSSATIDTTTAFIGNILAQASITVNAGASISGRALARTAAVTLSASPVGP
jgi:hypothetical protein